MGGGCAAPTAQGASPLESLLLLKLMTLPTPWGTALHPLACATSTFGKTTCFFRRFRAF